MLLATHLPHRSLIRIGGADRLAFLQGLVSNDIGKATETNAVYAALLTPQGKFLHDMFILAHDDGFLIDCEAARADDLLRRLAAYKLRAKVTFENLLESLNVWAVWGGDYQATLAQDIERGEVGDTIPVLVSPTSPLLTLKIAEISYPPSPPEDGRRGSPHQRFIRLDSSIEFPDPRLPQLGFRAIVKRDAAPANVQQVDYDVYDHLRLTCGVADGSRDMDIEKSTLAEGNFDLLNGVDWKKGCYIGQELTARMHYRGLAKKRLFPVQIEGDTDFGVPLTFDHGESGQMRSHCGTVGLALLNLEAAQQSIEEKHPFTCGNTKFYPSRPNWMPQKG